MENKALLFAVSGIVAFNILLALAVILNPELHFFQDYLSAYGKPGSQSALFFNCGCVIAGAAVASVFSLLKKNGAAAGIAGMLSGIALIGVGIFPTTASLHYPFSFAFFFLAGIAVLSYSAASAARMDAANPLVALGAVHVLFSIAFLFAEAGRGPAALFETLTVFAFEAWVLAASCIKWT